MERETFKSPPRLQRRAEICIPQKNSGNAITRVFEAEHADPRRVESEMESIRNVATDPPHRECAEELAVSEKRDRSIDGLEPCQHAVRAGRHLRERLAPRRSELKHVPSRVLRPDLRARFPFVIAIVPLVEILVDGGAGQAARQLRGAACSL